jgi:carboxypeptidase Q
MLKRNTIITLLLIVILSMPGFAALAQSSREKIDLEMIARIKDEGLKHSELMEMLSYVSDVCGPRLTGSPNLKAAQAWARSKLAQWKLENVHLESWGRFGRGWQLEAFAANMISPQFAPIIAYPKAWSPSTGGTVRGAAVYMDVKTEDDLEKYRGKLKGAIVLMSPPVGLQPHFQPQSRRLTDEELLKAANAEPPAELSGRSAPSRERNAIQALLIKKWELCQSEAAAAVLEPGAGSGGTLFIQSITIPQPPISQFDRQIRPWALDAPAALPQAIVAAEHYNRIVRLLSRAIPVRLEINISARYLEQDPTEYNVIAEIPGTDLKNEVVMLGAHLDSWHAATGATDNAAGTAVCLEVMRILQTLGVKPRRTIRVALWSGEEQGQLGSRAYVTEHFGKRLDTPPRQAAADQPTAAMNQQEIPQFELKPAHQEFAGYFNLDTGTGKIRGVYMQGNEAVRPIFRAWLAPFKEMGAETLTSYKIVGSDHVPFDAVGLPAFQFIQDQIEYETRTRHSNMDLLDRIQEDDLKQAAVIMAAFVYNAAMRDEKLPRKPLQPHP